MRQNKFINTIINNIIRLLYELNIGEYCRKYNKVLREYNMTVFINTF